MTDHAYVALIETPRQFDQMEDFVAALVRDGAGYANDIGRLEAPNHFDKGALLVLFTADRGLIDACFHLEFGFDGPLHFEHLDAFETEGDEYGAEIVGFRSLADEAGDQADTPEEVFAFVRGLKGWTRGPRREAHADPVAYEEAADDWNRRLSEMLPVAAVRKAPARARPVKRVVKRSPTRKTSRSGKAVAGKSTARKSAARKPSVKKASGKASPKARRSAARSPVAGKSAKVRTKAKASRTTRTRKR